MSFPVTPGRAASPAEYTSVTARTSAPTNASSKSRQSVAVLLNRWGWKTHTSRAHSPSRAASIAAATSLGRCEYSSTKVTPPAVPRISNRRATPPYRPKARTTAAPAAPSSSAIAIAPAAFRALCTPGTGNETSNVSPAGVRNVNPMPPRPGVTSIMR